MVSKETIFPIILNGKKDSIVSLVGNVGVALQSLILILYVWNVHYKQSNSLFSALSAVPSLQRKLNVLMGISYRSSISRNSMDIIGYAMCVDFQL